MGILQDPGKQCFIAFGNLATIKFIYCAITNTRCYHFKYIFLLIWYAFKKQLIVFLCISLITKWGWIFSHVLCLLHFLFCESNLCGSCIFSFSFPLKTPSCGAEEREHAGRARSNDTRAVNQFYWPSVADVQSSTCQDPSYLLETSGLCIQCFKLNSSSCLLWYWAYSSEQSRWKSFKN